MPVRTRARQIKKGVHFELYAGCCGISKATAQEGGHAESYEILRSPLENLKLPSQRRALRRRIQSGEAKTLWIGLTCASWSRARRAPQWSKMPHALRDDDKFIYGLPDLSARDQARVDDGNDSLAFVASLIRLCLRCRVQVILENPGTSRLWITREMQELLPKASSNDLVDYCSFGTAWRKRTRLVSWSRGLSGLPALCCGKKGICSYSGKTHELLEGTSKGVFKTAIASAYPRRMCKLVAKQLTQ